MAFKHNSYTPEAAQLWADKRDEQFVNLLFSISVDMGFSFDRVLLKKGAYAPIAHGDYMNELATMRKMSIEVLEGRRPLKMDITSIPAVQPQPAKVHTIESKDTKGK